MPIKPDPNAIAYWSRCPRCFVKNVVRNEGDVYQCFNKAILTIKHKTECPFITTHLYTTFNTYPIYSIRHTLIRHMPDSFKQALKIKNPVNTS